MQPAAIGPNRPEPIRRPAWGALVAALANGLLFNIGTDYLPSGDYVLTAICGSAIFAGFTSPERTTFAAAVLTLTAPFVNSHSSAPLASLVLSCILGGVGAQLARFDLPNLLISIAAANIFLIFGALSTFPPYWLLVQLGRYANLLLRKLLLLRRTPKRLFTDTRNIFPQ